MKFISWNLRNFGNSKSDVNNQRRTFSMGFQAYGLGNNTLDYIVKVATADPCWSNVQNGNPADVFLIVETKSGGSGDGRNPNQARGAPAYGSCLISIPRVVNAMNTAVTIRNLQATYTYTSVAMEITGRAETLAVIYNQRSLGLLNSSVLYDTVNNAHLPDRAPFWCEFRALNVQGNPSINVTGVHSSPPNAGNAGDCNGLRYQPPVVYNRQLANTPVGGMNNSFVMGDFNCQPTYYYTNGQNVQVFPFANLQGYGTNLANNTLSSVRTVMGQGPPYPQNTYLNDALDNSLQNVQGNPNEFVGNLIGQARDMNTQGNPLVFQGHHVLVFNAFSVLSDHLPVIVEF